VRAMIGTPFSASRGPVPDREAAAFFSRTWRALPGAG
jgi:hypothetical protein